MEHIEAPECPASFCSPESIAFVQQFEYANTLRRGAGVSPLREMARKSAKVADAIVICQRESEAIKHAYRKSLATFKPK